MSDYVEYDNVWPILYGKDSKGKIRTWLISTTPSGLIGIMHGLQDGKRTFKTVQAVGKNIGKANETNDAQQAILEAQAKWVKQKKTGYFETIEEALAYEPFTPVKAQNYNDHAGKIKYPCYVQPKLNGQRLMIDKYGDAWSKQGEPLTLPEHWDKVPAHARTLGGLDGEIYAGLESEGGLSLQDIISAFRKPNKNTPKLEYWIYDIPSEEVQSRRFSQLRAPSGISIKCVETILVNTPEEADVLYEKWCSEGYEGMVYRNTDALYEFGKRSYNLIKRKPRASAEGRVLSVVKDRNGQGVCTVECVNGEQKGNRVDLLMLKNSVDGINARMYNDASSLIGKTIEYSYEELSDGGIPTKPVGERLREVDENGNPIY